MPEPSDFQPRSDADAIPAQPQFTEQPSAPPTGQVPDNPGMPMPPPQMQPSPSGSHPVASGLAMKRRNPFAAWIGLPLITLGIYFFVWYYKIHKEIAQFDPRREIPVAGPMLVMLFLSWTFICPLVSFHNAGVRIRDAQRAAGLPPTCSPTWSWVLAFAFSTNVLYMQIELNKVIDRYGEAPPHSQVPLFV